MEFKIDKNIYSEEIILEAINDYSEYAKISYENWILTIDWTEDINFVFNEFMNYVIWLYNDYS